MLRNCGLLIKLKTAPECRWISSCHRLLKDGGNGGTDDKGDPAAKLNSLLLSLTKEEKEVVSDAPKIQVPKARVKLRMKKISKAAETKNLGTQIVDAAKDVAKNIDGDNKEIEAQLLHKLLYKDSPVKDEILNATSSGKNLTDLLSKMEVVKEEKVSPTKVTDEEFSRAAQIKKLMGKRVFKEKPLPKREQRVDLLGENPLEVFDAKTCKDKGIQLKIWEACEKREIKLSVTNPPSNYFEQMIDWTEKGIVWKFPIDNEQELEAEKNVSFASHVLLESHLEGWCPTAGPIRHFMELVCVGLSRNHWLSASEKEEHILWYKEFFTERKTLIKEIGAGDIGISSETSTSS